jgi:hypothetical protein
MEEVRKQLAPGHELETMNFSLMATAAAGPALRWLVESCAKLDHRPALQAIGCSKFCCDEVFIQAAFGACRGLPAIGQFGSA